MDYINLQDENHLKNRIKTLEIQLACDVDRVLNDANRDYLESKLQEYKELLRNKSS